MFGEGETSRSSKEYDRRPLNENNGSLGSPLSPNVPGTVGGVDSMWSFEVTSVEGAEIPAVPRNGTMEPPNFGYYQLLIGFLILTTLLAVASGYDARSECLDQEMYWLKDFLDDDEKAQYQADDYLEYYENEEGRADCLQMFEYVILPVGAATVVLGTIALFILRGHVRFLETITEGRKPSHTSVLLKLFVPLFAILLVWTSAIFSIMLKPKVNPSLYNQNPYKSLAAVDQMGHIGDNANLYYLSWMCQAQIMTLVYYVMVECIRRIRRRDDEEPQIEQVRSFSEQITMHEQIQTMLSYTSARRLAFLYKKKRKKWYQFMYHLRERSGMWVAAFFASIVLVASSAYVFEQVLVTLAISIYGSDKFRVRDVCTIIRGSEQIPEEFCIRSSFAVIAGAVASGLCLVALIMHILVRRRSAADEDMNNSCSVMATQVFPGSMDPETYRLQLAVEFLLSFCLSVLLGLNAVFATGVQGPAATVGNLYYASWLSFLLCLRITLGCLEELYHVRTPSSEPEMTTGEAAKDASTVTSQRSVSGSEMSFDMDNYKRMAKKERQSRLRKYFFLAIFSAICFASAWDAAYNQGTAYSKDQRYLILAPAVVSGVSVVTFLLCLRPELYAIVSHIYFGGLLSIVCFIVWLVDVIILMHSEDSWAVNSIGEMKLANLYYFSWAAILMAAMQMISYIKPLFGKESTDAIFLVWAGMVKVCMVILGASSHIWHNISDTCNSNDLEAGERTFCARTRGTMILAACSWVAGWTVMLSRIFGCSIAQRTRTRVEATLSIILVVLFGLAVALITSIGGPGQRVGDLYYATWIAFWVSIGIFISCYDQLRQEETETETMEKYQSHESMNYVDFSDAVRAPTSLG